MDIQALFGLSILISFVAFGLVTKVYIWPSLRLRARDDALLPLVVPHAFRFVGLSFLVAAVVAPSLPLAFAAPAAYGDLAAAILAVAAVIALSRRWSFAILLVWLFYEGLFGAKLDHRTLGAAFSYQRRWSHPCSSRTG